MDPPQIPSRLVPEGDVAGAQELIEWFNWTDRLFTFRITRPPGYVFKPGQFARLGLPIEGEAAWRAYSIVSTTRDEFLEFYGVLVPGGAFSRALADLRTGGEIWLEKRAYGFMTADRFTDGRDLWLLATGTGLGPYISMLHDSYVWKKFGNIVLVHGARHADEFAYQEQLARLQIHPPIEGRSTQLQIIKVISSAVEAVERPDLLAGRVTSLLENFVLETRAGLKIAPENSRVVMCGNPQMIADVRDILKRRGMRPCRRLLSGHYVAENYW
ncbi:ferredoxin--NADP reductase [soil metagenome]